MAGSIIDGATDGAPAGRGSADVLGDLLEIAADAGCVEVSELQDAVERAGLAEDEATDVVDALAERGVEVRDDCGREDVGITRYSNEELASGTTDALTLFMRE